MIKLTPSKTKRSALISALAACAAIGAVAAPANAKQLGHVAPTISGGGCGQCWEFALHGAADSPSYRIPRGHWKITSWSATGDDTDDAAARLLVIRPGSDHGRYRMFTTSAIRDIPANTTPTFKSSIKVRHGDRLGLASIGSLPVQYSRPSFPKQDKGGSTQPTLQANCLYPSLVPFGTGTACPLASKDAKTRVNVAATIKRVG
jgi:hypothetical protein